MKGQRARNPKRGCRAAIVVRIGVVRIHFDRFGEISDGPIAVAHGLIRIAAIFVSLNPWGDFDCRGEIEDCTIFVALGLIGGTPVNGSGGVPSDTRCRGLARD